MKRNGNKVTFSASVVIVMVAFLFTIFFAYANPSFAASGKEKSSGVARASAVEYTEAQIKQLQGALQITAAQEELWTNLNKVMRENAKDMDALTKDRAENIKTMNAVEHMKFNIQITEAHLNQQKKFIEPFEAFYSSMSDDQKKITDTIFQTGRYGKRKGK